MAKKPQPSKKPGATPLKSNLSAKQCKKSTALPEASEPAVPALQSPVEQQRLLDIFADAYGPVLSSDSFSTILQEVKQALYNRDFAAAFGREDYLEAYAARWSPTRTLGYATVFIGIKKHLNRLLISDEGSSDNKPLDSSVQHDSSEGGTKTITEDVEDTPTTGETPVRRQKSGILKMLSIGGCTAEQLAFASYIETTGIRGELTLLDAAPWASATSLLDRKITSPPPISNYASAAVRAANRPLLNPDQFKLQFVQKDVLDLDVDGLAVQCESGKVPIVVTLLFTLNELYTTGGITKTTKFLKNLGQVLAQNSLVLVVDSPGSYSEAALGKGKKKYPMQWLLDHTLLEDETPGYSWEKIESDESVWFRLPEGLSYRIPLENMRYQLHLYRLEKSL